jgi:hypothetical protein
LLRLGIGDRRLPNLSLPKEESMEKIEVRTETNPAPAEFVQTITPGECPTCVSGVDPTIGAGLFQEALHDGV